MNEILLTITQALQLVAIAPCIFVIAFLLCSSRQGTSNLVLILYFLSLGCQFMLPLLDIFGEIGKDLWLQGGLILVAASNVALSYLLIMQFLKGKTPPLSYWAVLFIPLGMLPLIYADLFASEICLDGQRCYETEWFRVLYNVFSSALIFLLLVPQFARSSARIALEDADRLHKYWLIIALIALNLILLALDLLVLAEKIGPENALFASTVIRISFIYLVLTSIFRVFYDIFDITIQVPTAGAPRNPEQDRVHVARLRELLEREHVYREPGLSREGLAKKIGIHEHQASRIINTYFGKSFNELINQYRVDEAKERLNTEDTQITVIAYEVGFNSIASFNRVFKELAGASPSEFRAFYKNSPR